MTVNSQPEAELRAWLGQVITLAEQAPELTDEQLQALLIALAEQLPGDQS